MGQTSSTGKQPTLKEIIRDKVWSQYPSEQMTGKAPNQTQNFFSSLPAISQYSFLNSTNRIIQLGVASGRFLKTNILNTRECIGYDYTEASASTVTFQHRLVDLDQREDDKLAYQNLLNEDLSVPCDILLIRLLEYLDDETVTLLLTSLIITAKPGSTFYIEVNKPAEQTPMHNNLSIGEVSKFFKPEENFQTERHSTFAEFGNEEQYGRTEQLVVRKIR